MKRLWGSSIAALLVMTSSAAFAADLPVRRAPLPPVPVYNWNGFYIGGNLGGAWASGTLSDSFGASFTGNHSGFIGGGQIGYNWQVAPQFVLGIEGMFDGTSISKASNTVATNIGVLQGSASTNWISTVAARFGYATNNVLFYGKAGGGWVENSATVTNLNNGFSISNSNTNSGWLLGAGVEYGLTPNWTVKLEYDHLGLSNWSRTGLIAPATSDTLTLSRQINMFTVGMNYKF
jgi:outer membrane immunogenic protein